MKPTEVIINAEATIGTNPLLVDVKPWYIYVDGHKSDDIEGYRYIVALPDHQFEKLGVKILGECLIDKPETGYIPVEFEKLQMHMYWKNGTYDVTASALLIKEVTD